MIFFFNLPRLGIILLEARLFIVCRASLSQYRAAMVANLILRFCRIFSTFARCSASSSAWTSEQIFALSLVVTVCSKFCDKKSIKLHFVRHLNSLYSVMIDWWPISASSMFSTLLVTFSSVFSISWLFHWDFWSRYFSFSSSSAARISSSSILRARYSFMTNRRHSPYYQIKRIQRIQFKVKSMKIYLILSWTSSSNTWPPSTSSRFVRALSWIIAPWAISVTSSATVSSISSSLFSRATS